MRLHGTFYPLKPAARQLVEALNADVAFDGAYSRVVETSAYTVLKVTNCEPTNLLLRALKSRANKTELALPAVISSHGLIATDGTFKYTGWTLERLFSVDDSNSMRQARAAGRRTLAQIKPDYAQRYTAQSQQQLHYVQSWLKEFQVRWGHENSAHSCMHIALAMSLKTEGALKETFMYLHNFVKKHRAGLDMLTRGNILANMFGELVLSDPVCAGDESLPAQDNQESCCNSAVTAYCLAAMRPVRCVGLQVYVAPSSTLPLEKDALESRRWVMGEMGLEPVLLRWGSAEHLAFLGQPTKVEDIWGYPQAAKRVSLGDYQALF